MQANLRGLCPTQVAVALYQFFHKNKLRNHLSGVKAMQFVRQGLDALGMGDRIETMPYNRKRYKIPPALSPPAAG